MFHLRSGFHKYDFSLISCATSKRTRLVPALDSESLIVETI